MFNLIITLMAIALVAALSLVTVNYLPWHTKPAAEIAETVALSISKIDGAYTALTAATAAPVLADEGASAFTAVLVQPLLKFQPPAPRGYTWGMYTYNDSANPASKYNGLHYVCMVPGSSVIDDEALQMGINRAKQKFSPEQFIVSNVCGATTSTTGGQGAPAITYFLVPSPDIAP